jgi:hypothetical protein
MVVVARSVPAGASAEAAAGRAFSAGVVRKVDAGRMLPDWGSAGTGVAGFGCCCAKRCWRATRSMWAMAVFLGVGGSGYLISVALPDARHRRMV